MRQRPHLCADKVVGFILRLPRTLGQQLNAYEYFMGSVKDLETRKESTEPEMGVGRFHFSDRYSVFDWGEMPDTIPNKGAALCMMAACCFEEVEKHGVNHHYRGLVSATGKLAPSYRLDAPSATLEIDLVRVIRPEFKEGKYNYTPISSQPGNYLIPLEVIYRNSLPEGSNIFKRLKNGTLRYQDLGLDHEPKFGEVLSQPFVEVTTKLESTDRPLSWEEARCISGLSELEEYDLRRKTLSISRIITDVANRAKLVNEDGKVEYAFNPQRELMLVDVLGTLDECRFTMEGVDVSKEIVRQFYHESKWHEEIVEAKLRAKQRKIDDWKSLCFRQPEPLPIKLKDIISQMYTSTANAFLGRKVFDSPPLEQVVERYENWKSKHLCNSLPF